MKVGVIGTGLMGRNHTRIYSDLRGVEEVFVTDLNLDSAKKVAEQFQVQTVQNVNELLSKVDAVSICVPTAFHYQVAKDVLAKHIPCLIEKPVTLTIEDAKKLLELSKKSKTLTAVGHIERFNPVIPEIKRIMGKPLYVEVSRHNPHFGRITDADVITDLMIHDIDMLWNFLFSNRKYKILGSGGIKNKMVEVAVALADFEGAIVKLSASRISSKKTRQILIEEDEKTIIGDLMTQEIYVHKKAKPLDSQSINYSQESIVDKVLLSKVEPLREELKAFLNSVSKETPFPVTVEDAIKALEVAEEIRCRI